MSYTISLYFRDGTVKEDETSFEYAAVAERSARAIQQTFVRAFHRGDIQDVPVFGIESHGNGPKWQIRLSDVH